MKRYAYIYKLSDIRLFFRWLKVAGIYDKWRHEVFAWGTPWKIDMSNENATANICSIIDCLLAWTETIDGFDFWDSRDYDWETFYKCIMENKMNKSSC